MCLTSIEISLRRGLTFPSDVYMLVKSDFISKLAVKNKTSNSKPSIAKEK